LAVGAGEPPPPPPQPAATINSNIAKAWVRMAERCYTRKMTS